MKSKFILIILSATIFSFITSCEGDCKDEQIEKVEWVTNYVSKSKDTLVSYTIEEERREYDKLYETVYVTVKNNDSNYSNYFSIRMNYLDVFRIGDINTITKEFVKINPNSSYTFTFYTYVNNNNDFKSSFSILQQPITISYKQRVDNLKKEMITVNSCNENVEALKEKYKAIKELYQQKVENNLENNGQK